MLKDLMFYVMFEEVIDVVCEEFFVNNFDSDEESVNVEQFNI